MDPTIQVALGRLAFGGSHTALSHPPIRGRCDRRSCSRRSPSTRRSSRSIHPIFKAGG